MTLCLIDLSSVYFPAWFATQSGIRAYDITTERVDWYRREYPRTVVCLDSPVSKRKEWDPSYKEKREKKPPECIEALLDVIDRIQRWGMATAQADGYEGEDAVASICKQAWPEPVVVVGTDKDLYALISDTVTIASPKGIIDINGCYDKWGVTPSMMTEFLAITGDPVDGIQGCPSCGIKRAGDLLQRFETIAGIQAATDDEILSVPGVGAKTLACLRAWDPSLALKLVRLLDDAPVNLAELLP